MALKSLKLPKKSAKQDGALVSESYPRDEYPYGTRLDLSNESLDKLGIKTLPEVGSSFMIECKVTVIGSRQNATKDKTSRTLELQITDMDLELDDGEEVKEGELTRNGSKAMNAVAKKMQSM